MSPSVILERVRKLLALAKDKAATPGEAAAAAAKAQELLFEHRLSLKDVPLDSPQAEGFGNFSDTVGGKGFKDHLKWRTALLSTISRHNFCRIVILGNDGRVGIIGRESDVEVVRGLFSYLGDELMRLAKLDAAACKLRGGCSSCVGGNRDPHIRAFGLGAVNTLRDRLGAQRRQDETKEGGTALVLYSDQAVQAALTRFYPHTTKTRGGRMRSYTGNAYANGQRAGRTVSLHRQVGGNASKALGA